MQANYRPFAARDLSLLALLILVAPLSCRPVINMNGNDNAAANENDNDNANVNGNDNTAEPTGLPIGSIGDQTASLGSTLTLELSAPGLDQAGLMFSASPLPLPAGASLDVATGLFTFSPTLDAVGAHVITFMASDNEDAVSETITITVPAPDPSGGTTLAGTVLESQSGLPLASVRIAIGGAEGFTDEDGTFLVTGIAAGASAITIDATSLAGGSYPRLTENITLIDGATNVMQREIFVPVLDTENADVVNPNETSIVDSADVILDGVNHGNVVLSIAPFTATDSSTGDPFAGFVSITVVPDDRGPLPLPPGTDPSIYLTIQPFEALFDPPAPISFPNVDGYEPGSVVDIFGLNRDTGVFEKVGTGTVSADGANVVSDGGVITSGSWHAVVPPTIIVDEEGRVFVVFDRPWQQKQGGSSEIGIRDGSLSIRHDLPAVRSLSEPVYLRLVYSSDTAYPKPVVNFDVTNPPFGPVPDAISTRLSVGGLMQGEIFSSGESTAFSLNAPFRQAFQFDAGMLDTGLYSFEMIVTCYFPTSAREIPPVQGTLFVNNKSKSPMGAGWGVEGLTRLLPQVDGSMLVVEADGSATVYTPAPTGNNGLTMTMFDIADPATDVGSGFEGLEPGTFTVTTADGSIETDSYVVPLINFPSSIFDTQAFYNFGPDNVLEDASTAEAPLGDDIAIQPPGGNDYFGAEFSGYLFVPLGGDVEFSVAVDDSMDVIVDGETVVQFLGQTGTQTFTGTATDLEPGFVPITIRFAEAAVNADITVAASGGGLPGGLIPQRFYFVDPPEPGFVTTDFVGPMPSSGELHRNDNGTFVLTLGDGTVVNYDDDGLLTSRSDPDGCTISYSHDTLGRVTSITYPVNQTYSFEYDSSGLDSITGPAGRVTNVTVQGGNLTSITNPDGGVQTYQYDSQRRLTELTTTRGETYAYSYDSRGMISQVELPNGETRQFTPSQAQALPDGGGSGTLADPLEIVLADDVEDSFTDGSGATTTYVTDRKGSVLQETDAMGRTVNITRDSAARITGLTRYNGTTASLSYDGNGNLTSVTDNASGSTSTFTYDAAGNLTGISTPAGRAYTLGYDGNGNVISYNDGVGTFTRELNELGLPTSITDPLGNSIAFAYDDSGNVTSYTDEGGHITTYTLDGAGNPVAISNDAGQSAAFTYDSMGRPTSITNELGATTSFEYDERGNPTSITDARGGETSFEYDDIGLERRATDAMGGETEYAYDMRQLRTSMTRPDGQVITYEYDDLHRRTAVNLPGGDTISYEYNDYSSLSRVEDDDSGITLTHSPAGILTGVTYDDPPAALTFGYDLDGALNSFTDAAGTTTTVSYDARPLPATLSNPNLTHALTYDERILLTGVTTSMGGIPIATMERAYTATYQLEALTQTIGGLTVASYDIEINDTGNRTSITDINNFEHTYTYDATGRLLTASHPDQPDESYTYDAVGNRLTSHFDAGPATYDAANRIVENANYTFMHDANGNMTSKTDKATNAGTVYEYDALNHLVRVESFDGFGASTGVSTYTYNGLGHRTSKTVNGVTTKYVYNHRGEMVAEYDGANTLLATYLYGPERQMALSMARGGEHYIYHRDYIGSVIHVSDSNGDILNTYQYDSFGQAVTATESIDNPFRFAGVVYDEESGLYYMKFRYYDPELGRFLTPDPYHFTGSGPNLYTYVKNNPVNYSDPEGLFGVGALAGIGVNLAGQGIDSATDKKGDFKFSWGSLAFDAVLGGVTCGLGSGFQAGKLATKLPKVAKAAQWASNTRAGAFIQHPLGNAAIGSFGKDLVVNQKIDGATVRDFVFLGGFNRLGGGLSKDFGVDELMRDALVNGGMAATEMVKNGWKDESGRKILDPTPGGPLDFEFKFGGK